MIMERGAVPGPAESWVYCRLSSRLGHRLKEGMCPELVLDWT